MGFQWSQKEGFGGEKTIRVQMPLICNLRFKKHILQVHLKGGWLYKLLGPLYKTMDLGRRVLKNGEEICNRGRFRS